MGYLIAQIILCLILAALLGVLLGWLLNGLLGHREDTERMRSALLEAEAENRKLRAKVSTLTADASGLTEVDRYAHIDTRTETASRHHDENLGDEAAGLRLQLDAAKAELEELKAGINVELGGTTAAIASLAARGLTPSSQLNADNESYSIEEIGGINAEFGRRLRALGISETAKLLERVSTPEGLEGLSSKSGLDPFLLRRWGGMADLIRVPGIRGQIAELLEASGIDSVQALANSNISELAPIIERVNASGNYSAVTPALDSLKQFAKLARSLPPKLSR